MEWIKAILWLLVFILITLFIHQLLSAFSMKANIKKQLRHKAQKKMSRSWSAKPSHPLYIKLSSQIRAHFELLLASLRISISPESFITILIMLGFGGAFLGYMLFQTTKGILLASLLVSSSPYLLLRTLLIHRRVGAQREFLPAVELFYQCYLITGSKQIKLALAKTLEEQRLISTMQVNFAQLYRNLSVLGDDEKSLQIFANSLGHRWADYFVQMLSIAIQEGVTIKGSLKELIYDMRQARKSNEVERHKLLEIRIANFTPILFLALFMGINFSTNYEQSLHYYFYTEEGREMLLNVGVLIFLSFLMGVYLSRKKMA